MVNPPSPGDDSFGKFEEERDNILASLRRRAEILVGSLNELEGISCNESEGALYAFPRITLPEKAVQAATAAGKAADALYCMELLEHTGIVVVPGSGFGQEDGTYHFRTTILPQEEAISGVVDRIKTFHADFLRRYS